MRIVYNSGLAVKYKITDHTREEQEERGEREREEGKIGEKIGDGE